MERRVSEGRLSGIYVTVALVVLNVIVFFALSFGGMTEDAGYMIDHGAMYVPDILTKGLYYELFTSMFLHFGFEHLMNNMVSLAVMGPVLERRVGSVRFLIIYLVSGLFGNLLSGFIDLQTHEYAVSAGASGAIFGIIGALFLIAIRNHGRVGEVSGRGIIIMVALSLYLGITSSGIDNSAHIGGFIAGCILSFFLSGQKRDIRRYV